MPTLGISSNHSISNMNSNSFLEFRKQAYFFIKDKIKTARLALTDATPAQLLTEEATNDNPWTPDPRTLALIARSAFEIDDYWRIVDILHQKLSNFDRNNWRASYNALIVLEHLLTRGPRSVADEFQTNMPIIKNMENFQHVDEKGSLCRFNWGVAVRKKSERVQKLLEKGPLLAEEREHARKLTIEIKGFGSFSGMSTSHFKESSTAFGRSQSQFNLQGNGENMFELNGHNQPRIMYLNNGVNAEKSKTMTSSLKENRAAADDLDIEESHLWNTNDNNAEVHPLLCEMSTKVLIEEEDHPLNDTENHRRVSLLADKKED